MLFGSFFIGILFIFIGVNTSPLLAIFIIVGIGVVLLLFFYPSLGLLLIAALVPIERFGRFTDDTSEFTVSLMRIAGILVLGIVILRRLIEKRQIVFDKTFFLYLAYCLIAIASITYTTDQSGTIRAISSILANLLFLLLVINIIDSRKLLMQALVVWLSVSTLIGCYSVYDWYLGSGRDGLAISGELDPAKGAQLAVNRWSTIWHDKAELDTLSGKSLKRTMGSTSHSAVYGINLVLTIPFLFLFMNLTTSQIKRAALWGALAIISYNILLTNTRATILLAGIVGIMCWYKGLVRISRSALLLGGLAAIILMVFFVPDDIYNRILDVANYSRENSESLRIREEYFYAGIKAFLDNWVIGSGVANQNIVPTYLDSWSVAPSKTTVHNQYLQSLMELGIIGTSFQFAFVFVLLSYCYKAEKRLAGFHDMIQEVQLINAIKISMIATLIYAVQVEVFQFPLKGWWLLAGMIVFLYRFSLEYEQKKTTSNIQH